MKNVFARIPRPVRFVVATAPAVISLGIFGLIARFQLAHDESRCPYQEVERRAVGGASVREESRHCIPEVFEHRWLVERAGQSDLELGRYPLGADHVEHGLPWRASVEDGRIVVMIAIEGRGDIVFREPLPEDERRAYEP